MTAKKIKTKTPAIITALLKPPEDRRDEMPRIIKNTANTNAIIDKGFIISMMK